MKLETELSVPSSASVFTFIGPHSPDCWESFTVTSLRGHKRKKIVRVCMLLDFELLLLLEQNLFYPWVFIFFFSLWSQDGEAPVNMVLRGDV